MQTRIVLADDHLIIREGLKLILEVNSAFTIVGEVADGDSLMNVVTELKPDLLITDMKMPGASILDIAKKLKEQQKELKILIFTAYDEVSDLYRALEVGIDGFIKKDTHPQQILSAIDMVLQGYTCFQSRMDLSKKNENQVRLTDREREIFQLIIDNLSNHEISNRLCISEATVKTHVSSILRKTGQPNRSQAVLYALREGLIPILDIKGV